MNLLSQAFTWLSDPAHWWRHRSELRFVLEEWEKLVAYRLGLAE